MFFQFLVAISTIAISSTMYFWSTGLNFFWPLIWIAPLPLLIYALQKRSILTCFAVISIANFIGGLSILGYPHFFPVHLLLFDQLEISVILAIVTILSTSLMKHSGKWWSIFLYPCLNVALEFFRHDNPYSGTLGSLAYTQLGFKPLIQMVSVTGIWSVTFLVTLFPTTVAFAWYRRKDKKQMYMATSLCGILLLGTLVFGCLRIFIPEQKTDIIRVGLLSVPESIAELHAKNTAKAIHVAKKFISALSLFKNTGVQAVLLPEKILITTEKNNDQILGLFQKAAKENHITLIAGFRQYEKGKLYNTAMIISPAGKILARYHKQHMLPFSESAYTAGNKLQAISWNQKTLAIAICKDMDFINPAIEYSRIGAGLLFVPALDFVADGMNHAAPAIFRGIEGGYSIVRNAQWGMFSFSDKYGQLLEPMKLNENHISERALNHPPVSSVLNVPIYQGNSFYSRYGDWFAWICCGLAILLCIRWGLYYRHQMRGKSKTEKR